jgi:hypothetical protein
MNPIQNNHQPCDPQLPEQLVVVVVVNVLQA